MSIIDEAFEVVRTKGPNHELIAKLGCELEQAHARNCSLSHENRNIRRSYARLKKWFNRQFKYYKAHRDELLNEKHNKMVSTVSPIESVRPRKQEFKFRFNKRSRDMVPHQRKTNLVFNSYKE